MDVKILNAGNRIMNTYVYTCKNGYVMIDTGYEHSLGDVEKRLHNRNIGLSDIKYVFLTHAHDDHAGFLNEMLGRNWDLKVIISDKAMAVLKRGQNSFQGGCSTFLAWAFCRSMWLFGKGNHKFPAIEDQYDDRFIKITKANKRALEELLQGKILFTPGHTSDSISLRVGNIVFCGDAAMNGFPSLRRVTIWIEDKDQFASSWDTLLTEDIDWIYPAHGRPFPKRDLCRFKNEISKIRLYKLR